MDRYRVSPPPATGTAEGYRLVWYLRLATKAELDARARARHTGTDLGGPGRTSGEAPARRGPATAVYTKVTEAVEGMIPKCGQAAVR